MKIAVVSGKGGSGKSSITAALAALSERVVAVDCDVDASNLPLLFPHDTVASEEFASGSVLDIDHDRCVDCGTCARSCAYGALTLTQGGLEVNDYLCEACGLCVRLCPVEALSLREECRSLICKSTFPHGFLVHGDLYPGDDNSGKMIARIREVADRVMAEEGIDLQLLDGPPGIGCPVLSTVTGVDRVVIVAEPSLSGMADLERIWKVCISFCRDIMVIINKADINRLNCSSIRDFCAGHQIPVIAELPFERKVVEAQVHCRSIVGYAPDSECARALVSARDKVFG